jgi:hypothetical protein
MEKNIMATLNGLTPEQIAQNIIEQTEDRVIEVTGLTCQGLADIARYDNKDAIAMRGEKWYDKNRDHLEKMSLEKLVLGKQKQLEKYLTERRITDQWKLYRLLVSKGTDDTQARQQAFPEGIPAPQK